VSRRARLDWQPAWDNWHRRAETRFDGQNVPTAPKLTQRVVAEFRAWCNKQTTLPLAKEAKRCKLENGNVPGKPSLSEADQADVESFLEELLLCFPVLGVTIFERPETKPSGRQLLLLKNKGATAEGYESEDGFVVKSSSTAIVQTVNSIPAHALALRQELLTSGILKQETKDFYHLTQDYEFSSPSTAAAVLIGASVNGRDWWKTSDGATLKQLQEKGTSRVPGAKGQAVLR